jgi:hypothetical protein
MVVVAAVEDSKVETEEIPDEVAEVEGVEVVEEVVVSRMVTKVEAVVTTHQPQNQKVSDKMLPCNK